jgi:hypothetical protein
MNPMEGIAGLFITVASAIILGIAFLLILYKSIDGELPLIPSLVAMGVVVGMLTICVARINPIIPAVILVVTLTLMGLFPFAATQLEAAELRSIDTGQLEKAYAGLVARPDNVSIIFEIARRLHAHGMKGHAIAISTKTLDALSQNVDQVKNRSLRDQFRNEEYEMKRWRREVANDPSSARPIACPHCGHTNQLDLIVCAKCGEAYVLTLARGLDVRSRFIGKLLLTAAIIAAVIVGSATLGVYLGGLALFVALAVAIAGAGISIHLLFRPARLPQ